jgi:hypothetical protein
MAPFDTDAAANALSEAAASNPAGEVSTAFNPNSREYGLQVGGTAQPVIPATNADLTNTAPPNVEGPMGYAERLAAAANQIGVLPGLGGWAKSLVASSLAALPRKAVASPVQADSWGAPQSQPQSRGAQVAGGVRDAFNSIDASLGDAAHAGDNLRPGQGALKGIFNTLGARNERLSREQTQAAMIAESNIRQLHEQKLIHQLDEQNVVSSIASGNQAVSKLKSAPSPAPIIAADITSDQVSQFIKNGKFDPSRDTAFPTGRKLVGESPDGEPIFRTTYSLVGLPPNVTIGDAKNPSKDKDLLDRLNKYAPQTNGGKWQAGQELSGAQFNFLLQEASDNEAATEARNKTLRDAEISDTEQNRKLEVVRIGPEWNNALANNGNDPLKALAAMQALPAMVQKYPNLYNDVRQAYGEKAFDQLIEQRQKKFDAASDELDKTQKDLDEATGEKSASIAAGLQTKLNDPKTPTAIKPRLQQMLNQANAATKAGLKYEEDKQRSKKLVDNAAATGDVDGLVDAAIGYQLDPKDLYSSRKEIRAAFIQRMLQKDPTWSEPLYRARYKTVQDFTPEGKGGQAVQSLNTFAGHAGDANGLISTLQNTRSPLLNQGLNALKKQFGNDKIQPYIGALAAASHEYINFLNNQHAKTQSDETLAAKLLDENTSPSAAQAALRQMAQTIAIRGRSLNNAYKHTMGTDYPDMLSPESAQIMRNFGIDISKIGGVTGENQPGGQPGQPMLPQAALSQLKEGVHTTFANGQTWTLQGGKPVQVQGQVR